MRIITQDTTYDLGTTETTPTIGITDFSRRVTDDFGVTTVVERGFARRMSVRFALPFDEVDAVQRTLAELRATPARWEADDRFDWLNFDGFYKDFELDLALPPLSYCTLTVEGLAQTEVTPDPGGDPAPEGSASSLLLVQPVAIEGAVLVASNVPETDYPEWSAGTTYAAAARVIKAATHRVYESIADGNLGNDPAGSTAWIEVGPTNRWRMFDEALGTLTSQNGNIVVTLAPGIVDALALLDVTATTVRVQTVGFDRTVAVTPGAIAFLDLPSDGEQITVTIAGPGLLSVGTLLVGTIAALGCTGESPTAGITDFSRKEVDDFGEVTVVPRAWAKRMSSRALIRTDAIDHVANRIAAVRARPSLWIADEGTDSLTLYGFFKDFSIEVGETVSTLSLSVEGLSKAMPIGSGIPIINWPDIADSDPVNHPKPEDGATVGAPSGTPVGDRTADDVTQQVDAANQKADDLIATYGDTVSAAASAATAATAATNAQQAEDDAVAARNAAQSAASDAADNQAAAETAATAAQTAKGASEAAQAASESAKTASETARDQAQTAATDAEGSATAAAGSASTATTKATDAGNSAAAAAASAVTAGSEADDAADSASAAATSATSAGTFASNAATAATAANNSSVTASVKAATRGLTGNGDFGAGLAGWYNYANTADLLPPPASTTYQPVYEGAADVMVCAADTRRNLMSARFEVDPTRKYRLRGRIFASNHGGTHYLGLQCRDASDTYLGVKYATVAQALPAGWSDFVSDVITGATATTTVWSAGGFFVGTKRVSVIVFANYSNTPGQIIAFDSFYLEDVTESEKAASSAAAASTSADAASASQSAAGTFATAAQTSSVTAAVKAATKGMTPNADFTEGASGWSTLAPSTPTTAVAATSYQGASNVLLNPAATRADVMAVAVPIDTARKYRVRGRIYSNGDNGGAILIGLMHKDGNGAVIGPISGIGYIAGFNSSSARLAAGWYDVFSDIITGEGAVDANPSSGVFRLGTKQAHVFAILNYQGSGAPGQVFAVDSLYLEDVTESANAAASASAASGFSSSAASSATAAGESAAAASGSANTATTKAGEASTSAGQAATSASNAAGSANTASSQATLAASTRTTMDNALSDTYPKALNPALFSSSFYAYPTALMPQLTVTHPSWIGPNNTYIEQASGVYGVAHRGAIPIKDGDVIRLTADVEQVTSANATTDTSFYIYALDENFAQLSATLIPAGKRLSLATGARATMVADVGYKAAAGQTDLNITATGAKYFRITLLTNRVTGTATALPGSVARIYASYAQDVTSEKDAAGSASAAASSASVASTKATDAGNSATSASTSANTATTKAGEAAGSATAAAGSANAAAASQTAAGTSASTASSSSLSAAVSAATKGLTRNAEFSEGVSGWFNAYTANLSDTTPTPMTPAANWNGAANVALNASNARRDMRGSPAQAQAGRKYRLRYRFRITAANGTLIGIATKDAAGAHVAFTHLGNANAAALNTWIEGNILIDNATVINGAPQMVPYALTNTGAAVATVAFDYLYIEDVTESESAAGSASAASTSQASAAASESDAEAAASAASGSANTATTAAGTATTKAGEAATSASNALGSANTATSQASLAASSATAAQNVSKQIFRSDFNNGPSYWIAGYASTKEQLPGATDVDAYNAAVTVETVAGVGSVLQCASAYTTMSERSTRPFIAGQKIRVRIRTRLTADQTAQPHVQYLWVTMTDAAGAHTGYAGVTSWSGLTVANGWVTREAIFEPTTYRTGANASATEWRLMVGLNGYNTVSPAGAVQQIEYIACDDVTESTAAAGSASAAAGSASTAQTKATEAGNSATSATTARNDAQAAQADAEAAASAASGSAAAADADAAAAASSASLAAGYKSDAQTQAGIATSQAAVATSASAASQSSAALSASVGGNALNKNPVFSDWTSTRPEGWAGTIPTKGTGRISPYAPVFTATAGQNSVWLSQNIGSGTVQSVKQGDWLVLEGEAELLSGSTTAAGVVVNILNTAAATQQQLIMPFPAGSTVGAVYQARKVFQVTAASAFFMTLYAAGHLSTIGSVAAANSVRFYNCKVRYATDAEIRDQTVLGPLQATVATQASTLATHDARLASWLTRTSAGTGYAEISMSAVDSGGASATRIGLTADWLSFGTANARLMELVGSNVLVNGDLYVNNGKIVADTGTYMKVIGKGFGTSNQFVEWFGPKMAFNLCSEANAITYIKTNGDAYFGGSLTAGTLKNSVTSSSTLANAVADTGTFGSNGGSIVVTVSWTATYSSAFNFDATTAGRNDYDAMCSNYGLGATDHLDAPVTLAQSSSLTLARKIGTGAFANVQSGSISSWNGLLQGQRPQPAVDGGFINIVWSAAISFTYTDNALTTDDRQFTATLAGGGGTTQRISITTVEE